MDFRLFFLEHKIDYCFKLGFWGRIGSRFIFK